MLELLDKKIEEKEKRIDQLDRRLEGVRVHLEKEKADLAAMRRTRDLLGDSSPASSNGDSPSSSQPKASLSLPDEIDKVLKAESPLHYLIITERLNANGIAVDKSVVAAALSRYLGKRYERMAKGMYAMISGYNRTPSILDLINSVNSKSGGTE